MALCHRNTGFELTGFMALPSKNNHRCAVFRIHSQCFDLFHLYEHSQTAHHQILPFLLFHRAISQITDHHAISSPSINYPNGLDSSFSSIRRGQKDSIPICRTLIQHAAFRAVIASSRFTFTSVSPS